VLADGRDSTKYDIPPQSLESALSQFALQSKRQVLFDPGKIPARATQGVKGKYTAEEALQTLLEGTGLGFEIARGNTLVVLAAEGKPVAGMMTGNNLALAQAEEPSTASPAAGPAAEDSGNSEKLDEIVVTAQKRQERLQDVPVPVTAISANTLVNSNQLRLQDYYVKVPSLSLTMGNSGEPSVAIRGISTGMYANPTVGIVVDDVPYGSSTSYGGGQTLPDIDPSDLLQIEVLRGPQGTLYGASSIGGLLKFVTADPSPERLAGRIQGGINGVHNGDELGYNVRGSVNVPVSDTFAVRASAYTRQDPGYIDDPGRGEDGVNSEDVSGGRIAALWKPSDVFSVKLSALFQDSERHGMSRVDLLPGLGDLQQSGVRNTGLYDRNVQSYNATLTAKLAAADLISVTGYSRNKLTARVDLTPGFAGFSQAIFGSPDTITSQDNRIEKFTQEFRLATTTGEKFDWLAGLFYTDEDSPFASNLLAVDTVTQGQVGRWFEQTTSATYKEYAAFATLTYRATQRFDVQLGLRGGRNEQSYAQTIIGGIGNVFIGQPDAVTTLEELNTKDDVLTYLLAPRFKLSPDLMIYARLASGYRAGGPNTADPSLGLPRGYDPDTTQNYEIGLKGNVLDHLLSFDASLYYIDWSDVQLQLVDSAFNGFNVNAGRAKSQGVELSIEARPLTGLVISAWGAWNDAELTEGFPQNSSVAASAGDRLPYSSRLSGNLSVDQEIPLVGTLTGFWGASLAYVGDRKGTFLPGDPVRQRLPSYARTDVRAGLMYDSWTVSLFVNNVTDKRGLISGGKGSFPAYAFSYIEPRRVGMSLTKEF
jgi:outer membrane receptor protein involved in Fe transport